MTPFRDIVDTLPGEIIRSFSLLLLIGMIETCIRTFRIKEKKGARRSFPVYICILLLWLVWMYGMLSFSDRRKPATYTKPETFILTAIWDAPWLVSVFVELLAALILLIQQRRINRFARKNILSASIKEAVDMLPSGICFGDETGTVVFSNLKMNALCRKITGKNLLDINEFSQSLKEKGTDRNGKLVIVQENEEALLFTLSETKAAETNYQQIFSSDVTALYNITSDLSAKHAKLLDIQLRMKAYQAQAAAVVISREIMKARAIVHDELGNILLSAAYYMDHPENVDASALLCSIRQTNQMLLNEAEEPDDMEHDRIQEALHIVKAIGVNVKLTGTVPEQDKIREMIGKAISECAFNAVKHANADTLNVQISQSDNQINISLTNNGIAPKEEIIETGGLLNIRRIVEESGGNMVISSDPAFRLTLILPLEK